MIKEVLKNFNEVEIDHNPFGHKVINNIFPKNFYQNLIYNLPDIKEYIPIVKTDRVSSTYPPERFIFELNNESISKLNEKQQKIGFGGLKYESLNKSPVFGRGKLKMGFYWDTVFEFSLTPSVEIKGAKPKDLYGFSLSKELISKII